MTPLSVWFATFCLLFIGGMALSWDDRLMHKRCMIGFIVSAILAIVAEYIH